MSDTNGIATGVSFVRARRLHLTSDPLLDDGWLCQRIIDDPSILGLGELRVVDEGRIRDGRLELLLRDPKSGAHFTVLVRAGVADESDLVRALEHWTVSRSRSGQEEHSAIVVAEHFPPRFIAAADTLGATIPLSALQVSALGVADFVSLHFSLVLDRLPPGVGHEFVHANGNGSGHKSSRAPSLTIRIKPLRRRTRLFALVAVISLLLCLTTLGGWVRSYSTRDSFNFADRAGREHVVASGSGRIEWALPPIADVERYVTIPYWLPAAIFAILPALWLIRRR
jgi:hypothetical protein